MKSIVITGSTRGIGYAMAKEFLKLDCNVTITGRGNPTQELEDDLREFKGKFQYQKCNVQNIDDLENLWNAAVNRCGKVNIWINNAGQNCPYEYVYNINSNDVENILDTNIKGVIYGSQVASKNMLKQGYGQIWNMEGLGSNDMIQLKTILYGTTKRAVTYFTRALAKELANTNLLVGRLSPGMMLTDFITKTPEGKESPVLNNKDFKFIFNVLGDLPDTVAKYFVPNILKNNKNDAHLVWLTKTKVMKRFIILPFKKRRLL